MGPSSWAGISTTPSLSSLLERRYRPDGIRRVPFSRAQQWLPNQKEKDNLTSPLPPFHNVDPVG
jgi:hypothetical protein